MEIPFKLPLRLNRDCGIVDDDGNLIIGQKGINVGSAGVLCDLANANASRGMAPTTDSSITGEGAAIKGGVLEAGDRLAELTPLNKLRCELTKAVDNSECTYEQVIMLLTHQLKWMKKARKDEHGN